MCFSISGATMTRQQAKIRLYMAWYTRNAEHPNDVWPYHNINDPFAYSGVEDYFNMASIKPALIMGG